LDKLPRIVEAMRAAVIDMGTNTFHLLIVELINADFKVLYREKIAVKIGKGGINKGLITTDAWSRAINTLKTFKTVTEEFSVTNTYATATSAIRNAKNGKELVAEIEKETGISARIIDGIQEAEYIYYGVKKAMKIGGSPALIMDIGGGSIEFIIASNDGVQWMESFEIGGQRLVEKFHHHDPIASDEIMNLEQFFKDHLQSLFDAVALYKPATLIGSSGTFDTLSEIHLHKKQQEIIADLTELPLEISSFETICQELISKNRQERLRIKGMIPLRVDMIVVAVVLIRFILKKCQLHHIRVSAYALKEGVLLSTIDQLKKASNTIKEN
jgi:exopolyphosphatase/guanosine-5'-triphosphate,3'-diphosphate pyrophosphatase